MRKELCVDDQKAYETGQKDAADGHCVMINLSDWEEFGFKGSHEAYKQGFKEWSVNSEAKCNG
nr:MAG TPA: hypothetical protein [Caudoviricetes sp.]